MKRFKAKILVLIMFFGLFLSGCNNTSNQITIGGSSSVEELMKDMMSDYQSINQNINIIYDSQGSSAGVRGANTNSYSIGSASREIKEDEIKEGAVVDTIAIDGIVLIVNPDNPIVNLSIQQIHDIYTGKITNWKTVGGKNEQIAVYSRDGASGTREAFESIIKFNGYGEDQMIQSAKESPSNAEIVTKVMQNSGGIGYISLDSINDKIKPINVDNIEPTINNIKNGKYEITRPFNLLYYPQNISTQTKKFIEWLDQNKDKYLKYHGLVSPDKGE